VEEFKLSNEGVIKKERLELAKIFENSTRKKLEMKILYNQYIRSTGSCLLEDRNFLLWWLGDVIE